MQGGLDRCAPCATRAVDFLSSCPFEDHPALSSLVGMNEDALVSAFSPWRHPFSQEKRLK